MQIVAQDKQAADMGLEYAKNASLSQKQGTCPTLPHGGAGGILRLYAFLTLLLPLQPNSQQRKWNTRSAVECSETRTALWNAVKRTVKHSTKRGNLRRFVQPLLLLKTQNHCKLQRFALCFTVRFTALHSAVRVSLCVSLRFTAPRVFHCSPKSAVASFQSATL